MRAKPTDIGEICLALPETELGESWGGRPTYQVPRGPKGKGFVIYRPPGKTAIDPATGEPYPDLIIIHVPDEATKTALLQDPTTPFITIDHFNGYNAVLVQESRIGELERGRLAEVLTDAWASRAPKKLVAEYFAES